MESPVNGCSTSTKEGILVLVLLGVQGSKWERGARNSERETGQRKRTAEYPTGNVQPRKEQKREKECEVRDAELRERTDYE